MANTIANYLNTIAATVRSTQFTKDLAPHAAFLSATTLGIPFLSFLSRIQEVVPLHDVWVGLVKAPVFGLIVAVAGCYQGMQVKANAEEVGTRTTAAVVMAIFMVIVLDAFFAEFFAKVGWG